MEIVSSEIFDFVCKKDYPNHGTVWFNGHETPLVLRSDKLQVCIKVAEYYVAFITYNRKVENETHCLAVYLLDEHAQLLENREFSSSGNSLLSGDGDIWECTDDRFYGLELIEPNQIIFDFIHTYRRRLTVNLRRKNKNTPYLRFKLFRDTRRFRLEGFRLFAKYKIFGNIGHQYVPVQQIDNTSHDIPKLTLMTPYFNGVSSDKSMLYADGKYTHLTLFGTMLRSIIRIDEKYLLIISTIINKVRRDNLYLIDANYQLLETNYIDRANRIKIITDHQSLKDKSFILDYSLQDKPLKEADHKFLVRHQLRCWVDPEKMIYFLWLPKILSTIRMGLYRPIGLISYFKFKKVNTYKEFLE